MGSYTNGAYVPTIGETGWSDELNTWLTAQGRGAINIMEAPYGAVMDGATNDAAAWTAALAAVSAGGRIVMPPGTTVYNSATPLTIPSNVTIEGAGMFASTLKFTGSAGLLFTATTGARFRNFQLWNSGTADLCTFTSLDQTLFDHVSFLQDAAAKYILVATAGTLITNQWLACKFDCSASASVSPISLTSNGAANKLTFEDCWWAADNMTAVPFCLIDNTNAAGYNYDNVFSRITVEQTRGGVIEMRSAFGTVFDGVQVYDLGGVTTGDLFKITKHAGGASSKYTTFRSCGRRGGTLGGGLYDINLVSASAAVTLIDQAHNSTLSGFKINAGTNVGLVLLGYNGDGITLDNVSQSTIMIDTDGSIRTGADVHANLLPATSAPAGAQVYCLTHKQPIWSDGTVWVEADGTNH